MLKHVFIVNKDLGMRAGKIAAQCCHGEVLYMKDVSNTDEFGAPENAEMFERYIEWKGEETKETPIGVMTKIIKKATYRELLEIMHILDKEGDIKYYPVYDIGNTQVPSGSLTCIVTEPLEESICNELFGGLKLL